MFWFRKNFGNVWKTVRLEDDEIVKAETKTIKYALRTLSKISKTCDEAKIQLDPVLKAAVLIFVALKFESFANDTIESKAVKAAQEEQARKSTESASGQPS